MRTCKIPGCDKPRKRQYGRETATLCPAHQRAFFRARGQCCHRCGAPLGYSKRHGWVCKPCVKKKQKELAKWIKAFQILEKFYGHAP